MSKMSFLYSIQKIFYRLIDIRLFPLKKNFTSYQQVHKKHFKNLWKLKQNFLNQQLLA